MNPGCSGATPFQKSEQGTSVQGDGNGRNRLLQELPAVHEVLNLPGVARVLDEGGVPRWAVRRAVQAVLDRQRLGILGGERTRVDPSDQLERLVLIEASKQVRGSLRPVVNATGVVLHTNLGRAPLAREALEAVSAVARGYSNLELDLDTGKRGFRYSHVEGLLCELAGAEAALVVNNNAAAVFLALKVLAEGRQVIVSRGELVEIGGSFRIPEILEASGAVLREVGTTNRTHLRDYERAIGPATGLLLKVHPSNYQVVGFRREVPLQDLVALARRSALPVMEDLGSGCFLDAGSLGHQGEPTVGEAVRTGVDLVTFSGDKLLGGPQAGILVGRGEILTRMQSHPLNRALRVDKMTLAALEATLLLYRDLHLAREKVPALAMLTADLKVLQGKAKRLARSLRRDLPAGFRVAVRPCSGKAGGGSLPVESIPGVAVVLTSVRHSANEIAARVRCGNQPVLVRIEKEEVILDVRTILADDLPRLRAAFREAFPAPGSHGEA